MKLTIDKIMQQAITAFKKGNLEDAERFYQIVLLKSPENHIVVTNLGSIRQKQGRLKDAELFYRKAIMLKPQYMEAHFNLAVTLRELGNLSESELSYRKAIELSPDDFEIHHNLYLLLKEQQLLSNIQRAKKNNNKIRFFKKISSKLFKSDLRLASNPLIMKRKVDDNLIAELHKIKTKELDKAKDIRYGNGRCSDYKLFENDSAIIKSVSRDLINIMSKAVNSEIFIMESFFNIFYTQSGIKEHNHISSFDIKRGVNNQKYSLTYYLSVGDQKSTKPGNLKLYDPDQEILPSNGTIAIFPASRKHSATYNGKTDRVMIGVNFYSLL